MLLREITSEEFVNFSNFFKIKSIYQTPAYAYTMNKQKFDSLFVGLFDDSKLIAASLLLIEKLSFFKYAYAPRGFLLDYENKDIFNIFTIKIKDFLNKRDVIGIKINPYITKNIINVLEDKNFQNVKTDEIFNNFKNLGYYHYGYNSFFEALKPRFEAILYLNRPLNNIFDNLKKELKSNINNAIKSGVNIFKGNSDDLEYLYLQTKEKYPRDLEYFKDIYSFYERYNSVEFYYAKLDTKVFLEYSQKQYEEYLNISESVNNEFLNTKGDNDKLYNKKVEVNKLFKKYESQLVRATNLLRDYPDGIVISSAMIINSNLEAFLLIDGINGEYKDFNPKHLMIWNLIKKYHSEGYKLFNFGGVVDPFKENNKYAGLNKFKLSFNPEIYEYIGDFELIVNNAKYFMYKNSASIRSILKK